MNRPPALPNDHPLLKRLDAAVGRFNDTLPDLDLAVQCRHQGHPLSEADVAPLVESLEARCVGLEAAVKRFWERQGWREITALVEFSRLVVKGGTEDLVHEDDRTALEEFCLREGGTLAHIHRLREGVYARCAITGRVGLCHDYVFRACPAPMAETSAELIDGPEVA